MKALCFKEPWASFVREGKKTIETRTWATSYRGDILLCASKRPSSEISGKAFAVATLAEVRAMTKDDEKQACCKIYPRAHAWILHDIKKISLFPVRGMLGLFTLNVEEKDLRYE